jgi:ATP-binding cassette subfamily B protein
VRLTKLSPLITYFIRLKVQIPYLPWILRLVWRAAPLYTGLSLLLMLMNSLIPLVLVYLSREIINHIQAHSTLNISLIYELSLPLGLTIVLLALNQLQHLGLRYLRIAQAEYTQDYLSQLIQEKTISLDLSFFDSQEYYDMLYRSYADALDKPARLINSLGDLFSLRYF